MMALSDELRAYYERFNYRSQELPYPRAGLRSNQGSFGSFGSFGSMGSMGSMRAFGSRGSFGSARYGSGSAAGRLGYGINRI